MGNFWIVVQLIFRPMTGEHHNKQFLTLGFPLALLRKHRSQSATQSYRPQDNYTDANIAVQRKVADYHANAVYFDLASAFSVSQDLRVSYHSERDSRFTSSLKQFQRNKKIRMRGFTRSQFYWPSTSAHGQTRGGSRRSSCHSSVTLSQGSFPCSSFTSR